MTIVNIDKFTNKHSLSVTCAPIYVKMSNG